MRWLNRLIPPNVYYAETGHDGGVVRAKYALVSLPQFERRVGAGTRNPYFWARFAQPTGLVWSRDAATGLRVRDALVQAILTTDRAVRPLLADPSDALAFWARAFAESYRTELRAEKPHRAAGHRPARGRSATAGSRPRSGTRPPDGDAAAAVRRWRLRRVEGKALSVLRLIKASFTFAGGADYIAWKISRHAGVPVEFSPWERRHPILAAPFVLWRLTAAGHRALAGGKLIEIGADLGPTTTPGHHGDIAVGSHQPDAVCIERWSACPARVDRDAVR